MTPQPSVISLIEILFSGFCAIRRLREAVRAIFVASGAAAGFFFHVHTSRFFLSIPCRGSEFQHNHLYGEAALTTNGERLYIVFSGRSA